MKKAVTFGEIMLRLQPPTYQRFIQAQALESDTVQTQLMLQSSPKTLSVTGVLQNSESRVLTHPKSHAVAKGLAFTLQKKVLIRDLPMSYMTELILPSLQLKMQTLTGMLFSKAQNGSISQASLRLFLTLLLKFVLKLSKKLKNTALP